jgi:outer membrane protein assembly factor BamB
MKTLVFACVSLVLVSAVADDWPQWMGPQRDNVWRESGLLDKFPKDGPKIAWRVPVAGGYAGPAVANGRVYVTDFAKQGDSPGDNFDRKKLQGTERVLCLDEKTGKELWKHEYPVTYAISYPGGPRCTPLINEGKVYTLGAEGNLFCFDGASGKVIWSKELQKAYNTTAPLWGYAAHPLIDGKKLITLAGGKGSQADALDKETGDENWKTLDRPEIGQGYVPPTIIEAGGKRQLILVKPDAVSSVDPETGKPYWSVPYTADNGAVIMTPVFTAGYLYQGGFNNRNLLVKLATDKPAAETVWKDKARKGVSPINVQPIADDETIYGVDQSGQLTAFKLPDGDRTWQSPQPIGERPANSGTAFIVRQGDRYWFFTEKGDLVIGDLSPEGYKEIDRAHVIEPTADAFGRSVVWCMPAFANKKMFVRNDAECICVDLAK